MTILRPYIYRHTPYRPPPLYQGLGSRVLQGHRDPGSQVTMGYRVTGSRVLLGHWVTESSGLSPAFSPLPISPGSPWSRVTGYPGYRVMGYHESPSPGSRVTMGYGVTSHPHPGYPSPWVSGLGSLWSRVTGSPWSQGHPSPGISNLPSPGLQGYHHHGFGSHTTMVLPRGGIAFGSYQHTIFKIVEG